MTEAPPQSSAPSKLYSLPFFTVLHHSPQSCAQLRLHSKAVHRANSTPYHSPLHSTTHPKAVHERNTTSKRCTKKTPLTYNYQTREEKRNRYTTRTTVNDTYLLHSYQLINCNYLFFSKANEATTPLVPHQKKICEINPRLY